jgi:putative hemolysin
MTAAFVLGIFVTFLAGIMFSGAERSVGSMSRDSLEKMSENGVPGASMILAITGDKRRFRFMFLSGRIGSIAGGTILLLLLLRRTFTGGSAAEPAVDAAAFVLAVVVFTAAEGIISRHVARGDNENAVSFFAPFIRLSHLILYPITTLFALAAPLFIKPDDELAEKEEALKELVKTESESGVIEEEEGEMVQSILTFADTSAREVMVPRIDVVAADIDIPIRDVIGLFKNKGHSRIPIYRERIDIIIGVIYAKDLLSAIAEKGIDAVKVSETMRKPYFVSETKKISELLEDLRNAKVHLAIVVDEYGGTSGIVALEDLIEEIVGEIQDEYDREERGYSWIDSRTVVMDGGMNIDEVNDILRTDIPSEDFDTLGGFLYHHLGFIPEGGEKIAWEDLTFTIREIVGNRIAKVVIERAEPSLDSDSSEE